MRTHTKKKPYQCELCQCFSQCSNLKTHIRTHTKEKLYQCGFCRKCFTYMGSLKAYISPHTKEKHYQWNFVKNVLHTWRVWRLTSGHTSKRNPISVSFVSNVFTSYWSDGTHANSNQRGSLSVWDLSEVFYTAKSLNVHTLRFTQLTRKETLFSVRFVINVFKQQYSKQTYQDSHQRDHFSVNFVRTVFHNQAFFTHISHPCIITWKRRTFYTLRLRTPMGSSSTLMFRCKEIESPG